MPMVISDSSTLIHLAKIGRLDLLKKLFDRIVITPTVWQEVVERGGGRAGASEVSDALSKGWLEIIAPRDMILFPLLKSELDDGEAEVIALAVECKADMILLDESEARRIANIYGLSKTGVIGICNSSAPFSNRAIFFKKNLAFHNTICYFPAYGFGSKISR